MLGLTAPHEAHGFGLGVAGAEGGGTELGGSIDLRTYESVGTAVTVRRHFGQLMVRVGPICGPSPTRVQVLVHTVGAHYGTSAADSS
jgi:hypothetical protein